MNKEISLSEANDSLNTFGYKIIKSNKLINYIAVVKSLLNKGYEFEIGVKNSETFRRPSLSKKRTVRSLVKGSICSDGMPIFRRYVENRRWTYFKESYYKDFKSIPRIVDSSYFIVDDKVEELSYSPQRGSTNRDENYTIIKPGNSISLKGLGAGTLGGIFQLEDFPSLYFGISNWHVLSNKKNDIIDIERSILYPGGNYSCGDDSRCNVENLMKENTIGSLCWKDMSKKREAAFFLIDSSQYTRIEQKNKCENFSSIQIGKNISIGDSVKICGHKTYYDTNGTQPSKKIYSTNAMVRVKIDSKDEIFTNQILVPKFSDFGDSGTIITNEDDEAIGLLFARTKDKGFSVLNNINYIFSHKFSKPQTIHIKGRKHCVKSFNLKK